MRSDGRKQNQLRDVRITPHFLKHPEGSVLIEVGDTRVICAATVEDRVPSFLRGTGQGWVSAEYAMLPRATNTRNQRESSQGRPSGRTQEIQRLIGRSLRAAVDRTKLGERTIWIDCDVIQADGGTRTASITGGYAALAIALKRLQAGGVLADNPLVSPVAAVSMGIVGGKVLVDLDYSEDSSCEIDLNLVMDGKGRIVEVQGTGERGLFTPAQLDACVAAGWSAIRKLFKLQREAAAR